MQRANTQRRLPGLFKIFGRSSKSSARTPHPASDKTSLGNILKAKGLITQPQLKAALDMGKALDLMLGEVLVLHGGYSSFPKFTPREIDILLERQAHNRTPWWRVIRRAYTALRAMTFADRAVQELGDDYTASAATTRRITMSDM